MKLRCLGVSIRYMPYFVVLAAVVVGGRAGRAADPSAKPSVSFVSQVMPALDRAGCSATACHGARTGKGGLRLSMFGAYPAQDYLAITRSSGGRRLNRIEPLKSLFLVKATGGAGHKGGKKIIPGSPDHALVVSWLARGARRGDETGPRLVSIEVAPAKQILKKGQTGRLKVTALYSDGSRKDVTREARYRSCDSKIASAEQGGAVKARGFGQIALVVTYTRRSAAVAVVVPQPVKGTFPKVAANNRIDELVHAKLAELGIVPSGLCTDQEFLRRAYLDVIGTLPTPAEARAYLADKDARKRAKLIDQLLGRDEYADFWALKWGDLLRIKSEYPSNLWPNGVQAYHRWVRDSLARNKPYDRFATELLTSTGSNFRSPPSNYYRALRKRDAQGYAEATAVLFMGARMSCARCHGHPTENWTLADNMGMAAFFAKVRIKKTQEWKEEIVYVSPTQTLRDTATRQVIAPKFLGAAAPVPDPGRDPRVRFAQWLTAPDNPWFARSIVNRMWFWLLGRGIVHEPDDLRPTNLATNPELLAYLEGEMKGHKYDLKHMYRLILNSRTYQLSSKPNDSNANDATNFSHYPLKRMDAEQFLDAIGQVTETYESYISRVPEPYTRLPKGTRATHISDGSISSPFLKLFGRPPRDTAYESDRCRDTSMRQALYMINSSQLENKISRSPRIARMLKQKKTDAAIIDEIFLAALSRFPKKDEKTKAAEYLVKGKRNRTQAVRDLMWAVLNTKEFIFNH